MNRFNKRYLAGHNRQKGAITMFSAVLILILLTELIIYAVQVGVFEQRKSANEARYKEAFHVAESGLQFAKEYLLANSVLLTSREEDVFSDGTDGWFVTPGSLWRRCAEQSVDTDTNFTSERWHPCFGESGVDVDDGTPLRDDVFYFLNDPGVAAADETDQDWRLPINPNDVINNDTQDVSVYAVLCLLDIDTGQSPPVRGCIGNPDLSDPDSFQADRYAITLLSRGGADCVVDGNGNPECAAQAVVSEKVGTFTPGDQGLPGNVPLTTRSNFPPNGTAEIVPNPNAGGKGVAISAWLQGGNSECPEQAIVDPSGGSWSTCERNEWYGVDSFPEDMACPTNNCSCGSKEKMISYAESGQVSKVNFDIVVDPNFPCDLFEATFGVSGDSNEVPPPWRGIMEQATVIDDCGALNEDSAGFYWATGALCEINSNTVIGSAKAPVFLVSSASLTKINGGAQIFGVLFVSDVEDPNAEFVSAGSNTIYGAAIIDATMDKYTGTFQIVYLESIVEQVSELARFGMISGGWTDFPQDWR